MREIVANFPAWGPHGLYATAALMVLSVPLGSLYAYVSYIGYRRDIVLPDPTRGKAAIGGALIIACTVFLWRHVYGANFGQWGDAIEAWANGTIPAITKPVSDFLVDRMNGSTNILERLFWALVTVFALPAIVGIALMTALLLIFFGVTGAGAFLVAGTATTVAAVVAAIACLPGFLFGLMILCYFLFVRLPLQVVYRQAIREGRWPTTAELVEALRKGTLGKADWQSNIMAYKARKFDAGLRAQADNLRRKM
jgi:hypothetical protein